MTVQNSNKSMEEKIKVLAESILRYKRAYYQGVPLISDVKFDRLEKKLRNLDPNNTVLKFVGTDKTGNVPHNPPMLSADKVPSIEKALKWADGHDVFWGFKVDGLSIKLVYLHGELILGASRGNGDVGENLTSQALNLKNIPKKIPLMEYCEVRGEAYMSISKFKSIESEGYKSPRNLATGTLKAKDPELTKTREIEFMAWDLIIPNRRIDVNEKTKLLKDWGFKCADHSLITSGETKKKISEIYNDILEGRDTFDFEMDGLIFKINDATVQKSMGSTEHHPRWMIALKFPSAEGFSTIRKIVWQVGRTNKITPVAEVDPIELAGATLSRVTLHNKKFIEEGDYAVGDKIILIRSGDVIPKIIGIEEKGPNYTSIPERCPICGSLVEDNGVNIYCTNKNCGEARFRRLQHYISIVKIEGIGIETLRKLWDMDLVKEPADLYDLKRNTLYREIGKNGTKIYDQIQNTKIIALPVFLASLGIPSLSSGTAKMLAKKFGSFEALVKASRKTLEDIEGIGEITKEKIYTGLHNKDLYKPLFEKGIKVQPYIRKTTEQIAGSPISGMKIYITGSIPGYKKEDLKNLVEKKGGEWANLSKSLDLLVIGNKAGSVKIDKAEKYGIKKMKAEKFLEMLEERIQKQSKTQEVALEKKKEEKKESSEKKEIKSKKKKKTTKKSATKTSETKNISKKKSQKQKEVQVSLSDFGAVKEPQKKIYDYVSKTKEGVKYRYEYSDEKSDKFWEIITKDISFTVSYGRIGNKPQTKTKTWGSKEKAKIETDKIRKSKEKKGYVLKSEI
ncbi:MAG: NAD-dependent DNA ligase LigA [Promethearchaeota archaeon]